MYLILLASSIMTHLQSKYFKLKDQQKNFETKEADTYLIFEERNS